MTHSPNAYDAASSHRLGPVAVALGVFSSFRA